MWKYLIFIMVIGFGCSNDSKKVETDNTEENIDQEELLKLFKDDKAEGRANALYTLNELKYPEIKKLLEESLSDKDEDVRIMAIQSIRDNQQIESLDKLIETFEETESNMIVANLCGVFEDFKSQKPIPSIIEKLKSENLMIVYDCILTLGGIGSKSEIPILEEFLKNEGMPQVFDESGFLMQYTQFSIGEMAEKSIERIKEREKGQ